METIDKVLAKYGIDKRAVKINIDFRELEQIIGLRLPDDYKYFLENYDEFEEFIGPEYLNLWKYEELLEWNKGDEGYQVNDFLPNVLAIGSNMGGSFIGIEFLDGNHRMILGEFIGMDGFVEIGYSFSDFLARLDFGKEWFYQNE